MTVVEPEFVRVSARGKYSFQDMFDFVDRVKLEADNTERFRVLMDCREYDGHMTEAERFMGGQKIAEVLGSRLRAALLLPTAEVTKLGELAAVNRGAKLLVTDSEAEAMEWLLSP